MIRFRDLVMDEAGFPDRLHEHRRLYPATHELEELGVKLTHEDFGEAMSSEYVWRVCRWGGYAGIAGRVTKRNPSRAIAGALRRAHACATAGRPVEGLREINALCHLGQPSFASKHLRFLAPRQAVILDSVISDRLGYPLSLPGYEELLGDSKAAAQRLNEAGIENPYRREGWYVCDVEAAVFAKFRQAPVLRTCR